MRKFIDLVLILGFLFADFLFFHDAMKPGENISVAQYIVGILSIIVLIRSLKSLFN